MDQKTFLLSGLNGATGCYLHPPLTPRQIAELARRSLGREMTFPGWYSQEPPSRYGSLLAPREGVDPRDLAAAGWGVVFAPQTPPEVREALAPLLAHRQNLAQDLYREYRDTSAPHSDESALQWLTRQGAGPGSAVPKKVPYYLLLVGDPVAIPFTFQYTLDVQYAVGRLHLESPEAYANYARQVVEHELAEPTLNRRAVFFGVSTPGDPPTEVSRKYLVEPLAASLGEKRPFWSVETIPAAETTKERLRRLLGGDPAQAPSFLFTAGHGVGFEPDHSRQRTCQGALVCQDWPGPGGGPLGPEHYLSAEDISDDFHPAGLVAFQFCCYGGGTPQYDTFPTHPAHETSPRLLAPRPFVARLPQRLLGHPRGGARAVICHIGTAWGYSFLWRGVGAQTETFEDVILRLFDGHPVGSAVEPINQRYAELGTHLAQLPPDIDDDHLADLWTATRDAESYAVLGDPAVRLA